MTTAQNVQSLYIAYFNRPADPIGLAYWVDQIDNKGQTMTSVANNFALQPEYASNFTGMNTTQIVNQLYVNLFNHGADLPGLTYWVSQVNSGAMTMGKLALAVLSGATGADATAITSKQGAAATFTADLNTGAAVVAYNGTQAFTAAKTWLSPVVDATTLATANASAVATINNIVNAVVSNGTTSTLTTGADTIVGTNLNDTVNGTIAAAGTLSAFDSIDGGLGVNTLNLLTDGTGLPGGITVKNMQNINLNATNAINYNVTSWGGTNVNVVEADATKAVAITAAAPSISVTGGNTVGVTDGTANANAVTTVSVSGNAGLATITGTAIANVTLASTAASASIVNAAGDGAGTLNLTVKGVTGGATITDTDNEYSTINVVSSGSTSSVALAGTATKTLALSGSANLTVGAAGLTNLAKVTIGNSGKVTADFSAGTVTDVNASASTGTNSITIDGTKATFEGGAGNDTVLMAAAPSKAIDGGAGSNTASFNAIANLGSLTAAALKNVTNFQTLQLTGAVGGGGAVLDVSGLPSGMTNVSLNTHTDAAALTLSNVASGFNLTVLDALANNATVALKTDGSADVLNLNIGNATSGAIALAASGITATTFETVNVVANADTSAGAVTHTLKLVDATATTLNVSGAAGVDFTGSTLTNVATVGAANAAGNITVALVVTGGSTVNTGSGNDTITTAGAAGKVDTINTGTGNDTVNVGAGNDVITFGGGDKTTGVTLVAGNGNNTVTVAGTGKSTITVGSGNNTITGSAGSDTITVGVGANTLTLGGGTDTVKFAAASTSSAIFTTIKDIVAGDVLDFHLVNAVANASGKFGAALVSGVTDYQTFLNQAVSAKVAGTLSWFQFGGDTYIVEEKGVTGSFVAGTDQVVKLSGIHDLTNSTIVTGATGTLTIV
jgi:S-layer protein